MPKPGFDREAGLFALRRLRTGRIAGQSRAEIVSVRRLNLGRRRGHRRCDGRHRWQRGLSFRRGQHLLWSRFARRFVRAVVVSFGTGRTTSRLRSAKRSRIGFSSDERHQTGNLLTPLNAVEHGAQLRSKVTTSGSQTLRKLHGNTIPHTKAAGRSDVRRPTLILPASGAAPCATHVNFDS